MNPSNTCKACGEDKDLHSLGGFCQGEQEEE